MEEIKINKNLFNAVDLKSGISYSYKLHINVKISDFLHIRNYRICKIIDKDYDDFANFANLRLFV